MSAQDVLDQLAGRGAVLTVEAGKLRLTAPKGTITPDLRQQIAWHRAALVALLTNPQPGLFVAGDGALVCGRGQLVQQDGMTLQEIADMSGVNVGTVQRQLSVFANAKTDDTPAKVVGKDGMTLQEIADVSGVSHMTVQRVLTNVKTDDTPAKVVCLVLTDYDRARAKLASLEAELEALQAAPEFRPGGPTWARFSALVPQWVTLRPVADYGDLAALETATGRAYVAHCADPDDLAARDAYRRLDDCWAAVLGLPEVTYVT